MWLFMSFIYSIQVLKPHVTLLFNFMAPKFGDTESTPLNLEHRIFQTLYHSFFFHSLARPATYIQV